jgi:hypothetical protein
MTERITDRPLKPRGRPLKKPPADAATRILTLASEGHSMLGIAGAFGTYPDVLRRWFDENPGLKEAFDQGRERERHTLHNALFKAATEGGNMVAAMFLLKSRHGYREGDQADASNRVAIQFNLPAALPLADFKVIEHAKSDDRA